ncbi:hypothetical protein [Acinetobacter terrestris]|uniref:hypothetical protein n=1 Tax=Acinetobacter terrestris TaxID=2529843 RepID=UPI00103AA99D|nr:hypothetical protein [Acinetobacter terrestris]TCB54574.1 hypothetical protein E0H84_08670 [Acinetobacter terrestris]
MNSTLRLGLIIGSIVTLLLIIVVYIFKPLSTTPPNTVQPKEKPIPTETILEKKLVLSAPVQAHTVTLSNQAKLIQQRDRLYQDFEEISNSLRVGQQPDLRQVSDLLDKQKQLVKTGALSANDAISYCQFLRQILPAMDHQINQHVLELEKLKRATS